jgi:hypothetical protein
MSTVTDEACFTANRLSSDGRLILFAKDTATVGSINTQGGDLNIGTGACGIAFVDGVPAIYPWTTTGNTTSDAAIDLGDSAGRFKDLYLSGGVVFGDAGGSGTPTANTLDSYEEGTWSGVIAGSTTAGTFTSLTNACSYTKIGRQVTVQYYVQWESGTGTGNLLLTGLPFTSRNAAGFYYAGTLSYANVLRTANATPAPNIYHNATQIEFLQIPTTDGDSTSIAYDAAGLLMGMHTYFTD